MKFATSGIGEDFDALTIQMMIEAFDINEESGPHSTDGWVLSHILNHCHAKNIPFTLVFLPEKGYYVKRDVVEGVIPEEMKQSFEWMP